MKIWVSERSLPYPSLPACRMITLPKPSHRGPKPRKPIARGKRPKGSKTSKRRRRKVSLSKRADNAAREACRQRGVCEAMGWRDTPCSGGLQWAHIVSRAYRRNNLRWRMDNCFLLCAGHHFRWTKKNEAEWHAFIGERIGFVKYHDLEREALTGEKGNPLEALVVLGVRAAGTAEGMGSTGGSSGETE